MKYHDKSTDPDYADSIDKTHEDREQFWTDLCKKFYKDQQLFTDDEILKVLFHLQEYLPKSYDCQTLTIMDYKRMIDFMARISISLTETLLLKRTLDAGERIDNNYITGKIVPILRIIGVNPEK